MTTRKRTEIWLVGQMSSPLSQTKLPSKREVLSLFFHYKIEKKQCIRVAAHSTVNDVLVVWEKARIPTSLEKHSVEKVEKMFREWQNLKKNKGNKTKRSKGTIQKEKQWQLQLEYVFDIAHANALDMIHIEEDKQFLIEQRKKERMGKIGRVDNRLLEKEVRAKTKKDREETRMEQEQEYIKSFFQRNVISASSSSKIEDEEDTSPTYIPSTSMCEAPPRKRGRKKLIDDRVAVGLDVAKLSDRKATVVLTAALQSIGSNPLKFDINKSSIRRERIKCREKIAESLKAVFEPKVPLTIHWDGKMIEDISGYETVDRLPILVSGEDVDQLLAVPKLGSGTGNSIASAVYEEILA